MTHLLIAHLQLLCLLLIYLLLTQLQLLCVLIFISEKEKLAIYDRLNAVTVDTCRCYYRVTVFTSKKVKIDKYNQLNILRAAVSIFIINKAKQ